MHKLQIKEIAIKAGFTLRTQPDGSVDLNKYVYDFANELLAHSEPITVKLTTQPNLYLIPSQALKYIRNENYTFGPPDSPLVVSVGGETYTYLMEHPNGETLKVLPAYLNMYIRAVAAHTFPSGWQLYASYNGGALVWSTTEQAWM